MGGPALALALLFTLPGQTTLDVGVRTATSGGLARAFGSDQAVPTADVRVVPMLAAGTRVQRLQLQAGYQPDLLLRGTTQRLAPLLYHRASAGALWQTSSDGPVINTTLSAAGGDVDFTQAADDLGNPFGLGAAGGILTIAAGTLRVEVSDVIRRWRYRQYSQLRTVSTPTAYAERLPPLQVVPTVGGEVGYVVTRRDRAFLTLEGGLAMPHLLASSARSPRIHPAYVGVTPGGRWEHRWSRNTDVRAALAVLVAYQRTGYVFQQGEPVLFPDASLQVTDRRRLELLRFATTVRAFVQPTYDPFLVGLTERAGAQVSLNTALGRFFTVDATVQGAVLVGELTPFISADVRRDRLFTSLSVRTLYWLHENVILEGGGAASTRVGVDGTVAPQITGYVALTAGMGLDV